MRDDDRGQWTTIGAPKSDQLAKAVGDCNRPRLAAPVEFRDAGIDRDSRLRLADLLAVLHLSILLRGRATIARSRFLERYVR